MKELKIKKLHNKISNRELKEKAKLDSTPKKTISFYKYYTIEDPQTFRDELYLKFLALGVMGRVYIANEGINAQISVPIENLEKFKELLYSYEPLNGIRLNIAIEENSVSFFVLRMKVRKKIVADGIEDPEFNANKTGKYLKAHEVNEMIEKENTIFVDMRNHYEYEVGRFENALEIPSDTFKEQLPMAAEMLKGNEDKEIIMYCTGGIRCEKASAYMLHNGFKNVYHVEGGVIEYARQAKKEGLPLKFIGKNFVFDERMAERITEDILATCHQCGTACDTHTNCQNTNCNMLFIQCEACKSKFENCCTVECIEISKLPREAKRELLNKRGPGKMFFNKSKDRLLTLREK
ncbi:MAG: rhodanese-related sulfurtransferase [Defluviitaleaceae bacterium]|nr:rhodanese-related sulfurtransferase [Defluviitaleaceae bacterium]